jgi:hypothetical protein
VRDPSRGVGLPPRRLTQGPRVRGLLLRWCLGNPCKSEGARTGCGPHARAQVCAWVRSSGCAYVWACVAVGCDQLPPNLDGKEGVDGSSPSEGFAKAPLVGAFMLFCSGLVARRRTCGRYGAVSGAFRSKKSVLDFDCPQAPALYVTRVSALPRPASRASRGALRPHTGRFQGPVSRRCSSQCSATRLISTWLGRVRCPGGRGGPAASGRRRTLARRSQVRRRVARGRRPARRSRAASPRR